MGSIDVAIFVGLDFNTRDLVILDLRCWTACGRVQGV